jgi:hypothetical protein
LLGNRIDMRFPGNRMAVEATTASISTQHDYAGLTAASSRVKRMPSASSSLRTGRRSTVVARSAEAPHLRALAAALPKQRYAFLSIDADGENAASVFAFHRYYGLRYAALDPSARAGSFSAPGAPGPISTRYRVESYPTFYVLAPNGRIVWRSDGGAARRAPAPRAQARQPEWAKAAAVCLTAAAPTELFCFV